MIQMHCGGEGRLFNFSIRFRRLPLIRNRSIWSQILEHPLVQYIPLTKDPIVTREDYPLVSGRQHNILVFNEPNDLRHTLARFELDPEILQTIDWRRELPILSTNLELTGLMYRTNKVVAIGRSRPRYLGLFTVNRGYFYRDKIFFTVHDETGRRMTTPTTFFTVDNGR